MPGNEKADEWAKLATGEPDAHGVEHTTRAKRAASPSPVTSALAALDHRGQRREVGVWAESEIAGEKYQNSRLREPRQKPDPGPANAGKWFVARFFQFTGSLLR